MAKTTPVSPSPAKPEYDPVADYEAKFASPQKPQLRLPRFGCIWMFFIVFFIVSGLATGFYHSVGEIPTSFEIPEGRVTISDPEGVLIAEDEERMKELADEISKMVGCSVALIFPDERFASPTKVFNQIASEWAPKKGVLLVQNVREPAIRFGLIGESWRIADWDEKAVRKELSEYRFTQRGAQAIALLERLKHSIQMAAKIPAGTGNAGQQTAAQSGQSGATQIRNPANMTDEEIEKQMEAEEKAAEAALDAELEDEEFDDDPDVAGKGTAAGNAGILYSTISDRDNEASAMRYALVFLSICWLLAVAFLIGGKSQRARDLKNGPRVLEEYRSKRESNKRLILTDTNKFDDSGILRKNFMRIIALVLGLLLGFGLVVSTLSEKVQGDEARPISSLVPDAPIDGWRIVDNADVFGEEGTAKLAAAIRHLEAQTGGEMMVLTVPTIGTTRIEEFGLDTAMKWKIGKKGVDNGALLVLAINDHLSRLEIGYGWEGPVNDARAGDLLRLIVPELRAEQYAEAAIKVVQGVEYFVTGVRPEDATATNGQQPAQKKVNAPVLREYPTLTYAQPERDPRILDPMDSLWGAIGVLGCLIAILLAYWGRIVGTSLPHLVIVDPTAVHYSSGSGGSSSSGSSRSSYSSHSYSSSASHSSGGGGGSFGGGGASGRW